MGRKIIKFSHPGKHKIGSDIMVVIGAIASAAALFFLLFVFVKFSGLILPRPEYDQSPLRGVALEKILYKPSQTVEADALLEKEILKSLSAHRGESDVDFLNFTLTLKKTGKLDKLEFSINENVRQYAVTGLQLYIDDIYMYERPLFEGSAVFENLNFPLGADESVSVKVTGKISENAVSSDRIQIGISKPEDIVVRSTTSEKIPVYADFPFWGRYVSVIGSKL